MLFRPTQKLATKVKLGKRIEKPVEQNALADWSANLFVSNRLQFILLSNTQSLYSFVMPGKGISSESKFIDGAIHAMEEFMCEDGLGDAFANFVLPSTQTIHFGKALNRSVTGSMNDHIFAAKIYLEDNELHEVGRLLNQTPLSVLVDEEGENYNSPDQAIRLLLARAEAD